MIVHLELISILFFGKDAELILTKWTIESLEL